MQKNVLLLALAFMCKLGCAQQIISNNGKFVAFSIDKTSQQNHSILVVSQTSGSWQLEVSLAKNFGFSSDSRQVYYQRADTLFIFSLITKTLRSIPKIQSFHHVGSSAEDRIAYRLKRDIHELHLMSLSNFKETVFTNSLTYITNAARTIMVVQDSISASRARLCWFNLNHNTTTYTKMPAGSILDYSFDQSGHHLGLMVRSNSHNSEKTIYYCSDTSNSVVQLVRESTNLDKMVISQSAVFATADGFRSMMLSTSGRNILFRTLKRPEILGSHPSISLSYLSQSKLENPAVDVWSYLDEKIPSHKMELASAPRSFAHAVNVRTGKILAIEADAHEVLAGSNPPDVAKPVFSDDYAVILRFKSEFLDFQTGYFADDWDWNKALSYSAILVDLNNGERTILSRDVRLESSSLPRWWITPDGAFIISFAGCQGGFQSLELKTKTQRSLSAGSLFCQGRDSSAGNHKWGDPCDIQYPPQLGIHKFLAADQFGNYWLFDASGKAPVVNITKKLSIDTTLKLNYLFTSSDSKCCAIYFSAELRNGIGYNGIYRINLGKRPEVESLVPVNDSFNIIIKKSLNAEVFLINAYSANFPMTFRSSTDFKSFRMFTSSALEERRWVRRDFHRWITFDGTPEYGVMSFPDDFSPLRRYPVIVTYYDWLTPREYFKSRPLLRRSEDTSGAGTESEYLVFSVGIHFKVGDVGPGAFNSIVSGAKYISSLPYVNKDKMGLSGASFGGFHTYYVVTHTDVFAAAYAGCGWTDMIAQFGAFSPRGRDNYASAQHGQAYLGVLPWERPDLYIKNSPIFYADRVVTPLLIDHNPNDQNVPFQNGLAMFIALRRLGKRAWLLAGETGHLNTGYFFQKKYLRQFFDHYLKGAPAPRWMLYPVSASEQGSPYLMTIDSTSLTPPSNGLRQEFELRTADQQELLKTKTHVDDSGFIIAAPNLPSK